MSANAELVLIAHSARSTDAASGVVKNDNWRGAHFTLRINSGASTAQAVTLTVQGLVPGTTATFYTVLASTPTKTTGVNVFKVYPDGVGIANLSASDLLPTNFRVNSTLASTHSITYGVGVNLVR